MLFLTSTFVFGSNNEVSEKLEYEHHEDFFIVHFKENVSELHIRGFNYAMGNVEGERIYNRTPSWLENTPYERTRYVKAGSSAMADEMAKYMESGLVEDVEPIYKYELLDWNVSGEKAYPNDWDVSRHWYFERIGLPSLWYNQGCHEEGNNSCGGSDEIIVAVIDTGLGFENYSADFDYFVNPSTRVNYSVEFGKASEQEGVNLWTNPNPGVAFETCGDVHGIDMEVYTRNLQYQSEFGDLDCELKQFEKEGQPNDDRGHGTFVSGIIASATNNNASSVGLSHNVSIMTLKANIPFDRSFYADSVANSIYYAVAHGAHVINMSLGSASKSTLISNAVDHAVENDVVVVAASGNSGEEGVNYPAALSNVIAVGATDASDQRTSYSTYGSELDFVAPVGNGAGVGDAVWHQTLNCASVGCNSSSDFTSFSTFSGGIGTSYASPQVAAAAALILGVNQDLDPSEVKIALQNTAEDIGDPGKNDETGYGLLKVEELYSVLEELNDDASLSSFSVGGENVLVLDNIEVANPEETGAILWKEDFSDFTGIVATPTDSNASRTVKLNDAVVDDADLLTQSISEDDVILVEVTAEDGETIKYYKVSMYRILSDNASLSNFSVGGENVLLLDDIEVANPEETGAILWKEDFSDFTGIVATPTDSNASRTVKLNDAVVDDADLLTQSISEDDVILVEVTARDGETVKYYKVSMYRILSDNASLSSFSVGGEDVLVLDNIEVSSPEETGAVLWKEDFSDFTGIVATPIDSNASRTVKLNDVIIDDADLLTQTISEDDVILVEVTAEDGETIKYYKVTTLLLIESEESSLLYQVHVGGDGRIYTRSSSNGVNWSSWTRESKNSPGEATYRAVAMASHKDKLYQSHVGTDGRIYTRFSGDGTSWSPWTRETKNSPGERTYHSVGMTSHGNNLYQTHVGTDGRIYTRSSSNGISWSSWTRETKTSPGEATRRTVAMISHSGNLYQSHIGTDGRIYTRFSGNGTSWSPWTRETKNAPGERTNYPIAMASHKDKLYQSHVGTDGRIYTRSSSNGISWSPWTRETKNAPGESTLRPIAMTSFGNNLYQSHVGIDGKIYTRSSENGIKWSPWLRERVNSPGEFTNYTVNITTFEVL